jgi:hypothetical protein
MAAGVASRACLYAWGREPGASLSDAHGGRPWVGGVMRRDFSRREPTTAPTPDTMTRRRSICGGGAHDITNTDGIHHRRNCGAGAKHKPRPVERSEGRF